MARGFLSDGGRERNEDATVTLNLGWSTDRAWGFHDPFSEKKPTPNGRAELIWVPRAIRNEPLQWDGPNKQGVGKLTGPRWLLESKGLI